MSKILTAKTIQEAVALDARERRMFNESEGQRRALFNQVTIETAAGGVLPLHQYSYLRYQGILPLRLPDGFRGVVIPDPHMPAHHKPIFFAFEQFLSDYRPHSLFWIGDSCDFFALSRWPKPPRQVSNLMGELEESREVRDRMKAAAGSVWDFETEGNHDGGRTNSWLMFVGAQIQGLVDMNDQEPVLNYSKMLGYKAGDPITFVSDNRGFGGFGGGILLNGGPLLVHGLLVRPKPGASPRGLADIKGRSVSHGHTHRLGENHRETLTEIITAQEVGMMVNPNHAMMSYANLRTNWHPGFGVITVVNGIVHLETVPVIQTLVNGRLRYSFWYGDREYVTQD